MNIMAGIMEQYQKISQRGSVRFSFLINLNNTLVQ